MRRRAKKKARAPSDLNRMAAYRFGRTRPSLADESRPAWLGSAASARSVFFSVIFVFPFWKSLLDSKFGRNISVGPKFVIKISRCS
jgi:hypothetical protein